jgi:acyl-[acyl-carrier-protein]-phospholipid O-acyltransferase/long-chain-fatty-acid--[acyl-carrier-protein] ligase
MQLLRQRLLRGFWGLHFVGLAIGLVASAPESKDAAGIRGKDLPRQMLRSLRRRRRIRTVSDSTGASLTGGALITRSLVLRRLLRRLVLSPDERYVGVLLPPTCAAVATNVGLTLDRRITVNLNYTLTSEMLNACIRQAGIRHVLTSRRFMERLNYSLDAEIIYLEDLRDKPTTVDKLVGAFQGYILPLAGLLRLLRLNELADDDLLTVVFTSGSTGQPKGAMLSLDNVSSNIEAVEDILRVRRNDILLGVLPFFHSFGFTITLWALLTLDLEAVYHVNPLDAQIVGKLARERKATILLATPMFLRTYIQRCDPGDFASLEVLITGGERLPIQVADACEAAFGIRPVEGYGATETSPLIAANIPLSRTTNRTRPTAREGTVGRVAPGVRVKVTDLDTGRELAQGEEGMLHVIGRNVMRGYLGQPEATSAVIHDGWYETGDVARIDGDGFITIVGRESRFAKIAGEKVPHGRVEEALTELIGDDETGGIKAVVTSIPDVVKGERLVVVHIAIDQTPRELQLGLAAAGLPNLYIPASDSYVEVDVLPIVGTGKHNLKAIRQIALDAFALKSLVRDERSV